MNEIDSRNKYGETPLMVAAERGQTDEVRRLLQAGADLTLKDHEGITALEKAQRNRHADVAALLGGVPVSQRTNAEVSVKSSVSGTDYRAQYVTTRRYGVVLQIIGKALMLVGLAAIAFAATLAIDTASYGGQLGRAATAAFLVPMGLVALPVGLFTVVSGQLLHATAFAADANGEMLAIMKAERVRRS